MIIKMLIAKKYVKLFLIALVLTVLLTNTVTKNISSGYYNKIFTLNNQKSLSPIVSSLIITTDTGDQNFENKNLIKLYRELNIIHLLVLSGSNLIIFRHFFSHYLRKNKTSHFVINLLAIYTYFCYINYLHPIARALIFTLLAEFLTSFGFKFNKLKVFLILVFLTFFTYLTLYNSNSFLLSAIFSLLTYFYSVSNLDKLFNSPFVNKYFLYPTYMTLFSLPISLIFFGKYNLFRSFISNLIIVPFYDSLVLYMYFLYLLELIPDYLNLKDLIPIGIPIEAVIKLFKILLSIFELYNI